MEYVLLYLRDGTGRLITNPTEGRDPYVMVDELPENAYAFQFLRLGGPNTNRMKKAVKSGFGFSPLAEMQPSRKYFVGGTLITEADVNAVQDMERWCWLQILLSKHNADALIMIDTHLFVEYFEDTCVLLELDRITA